MLAGDVVKLLGESRLSPEAVALRLSVSNSTYRRWMRKASGTRVPERYRSNIMAGVHRLLTEGSLSHDSSRVRTFLLENQPTFFDAAIAGIGVVSANRVAGGLPHQEQITALLCHLGNHAAARRQVENSGTEIRRFKSWGDAWKSSIGTLADVITNKKLSITDKLVAYGALFYLIFPFDLVPDGLPEFGYVDDFGMLTMATAFYARTQPATGARGTRRIRPKPPVDA